LFKFVGNYLILPAFRVYRVCWRWRRA
jgi:hypothetical protein